MHLQWALCTGGVRILTIFRRSWYVMIPLTSQSTVRGLNVSAEKMFLRSLCFPEDVMGSSSMSASFHGGQKQNWFKSVFKKVEKGQPVSS